MNTPLLGKSASRITPPPFRFPTVTLVRLLTMKLACIIMVAGIMTRNLGRFIQPDPTVPDAKDSQSFNRYSYCRNNNPLNETDPSGYLTTMGRPNLLRPIPGALLVAAPPLVS